MMNAIRFSKRMPAALLAIAAVAAGAGLTVSAQELQVGASAGVEFEAQAGVEVQMRGPVHEAFAEVISYEPAAGILVPAEPPAPVDEIPPEQKPEGENVVWIAGYWSWDDERNNFLWVSGVWRVLPPERQFVPGYWANVADGWQWVSGYWVETEVEEVEYIVDAPPATLEVGPNVAPPTTSHVWVPGCWVWRTSRYLWRPGYYVESRPGWIWTPGRYVWTPGGFLYVDGYWDYDIEMRGVLFAPVYFEQPVYAHVGYYYSPSVVVDLSVITSHLFVRPTFHHYFFGDFYAAHYSVGGCLPWFSFHASHHGYDPIFAHHRVHHLAVDHSWETRVRADFEFRVSHVEARPVHTFSAQTAFLASSRGSVERSAVLGRTLTEVVKTERSPLRFERLDNDLRRDIASHGQSVQKFRNDRMELETASLTKKGRGDSGRGQALKVKLPESPVSQRAVARIDRGRGRTTSIEPGAGDQPKGRPSIDRRGGRGEPTVVSPDLKTRPSVGRGQPDTGRGGSDRGPATVSPRGRGDRGAPATAPAGGAAKPDTGRGRSDRGPTAVSPRAQPDKAPPVPKVPTVQTRPPRGDSTQGRGSQPPSTGRGRVDRGPSSDSPKGKPDTGSSTRGGGRQITPPADSTGPARRGPDSGDKSSRGRTPQATPKPDTTAPKGKSGSDAPKAPPRSDPGGPARGSEPPKGGKSDPGKGRGKR